MAIESLAPLFSSQHLVPELKPAECELRDVIYSFALTHPNTLLLASLLDLLGVDLATLF